ERPRTLLALDNVERDLDALLLIDTLAVPGHATLLLTSRYALAPRKLFPIPLPPLDLPDAATLLRKRLHQIDAARPDTEDEAHLAELAAVSGGVPLAVELVANYAGVQHLRLPTVLAQLQRDGLSAAALHDPLYPQRALEATFARSWEVLSAVQQHLRGSFALGRD